MNPSPAYRLARVVTQALLGPWLGLEAEGTEHVPPEGPLVVAANHVSYLDPLALGAVFPRPIRYLMMRAYYDPWYLRWFCAPMGAIPVDVKAPTKTGALKGALRVLDRGGVVGIFPEGRRGRDGALQPFERGVELLALRGRAPVVPAFIAGTLDAMPVGAFFPRPRKVRVRFGPPLPPDGRGLAARLEEAVRRLAERGA
jgi:1-acyl-sn-glycerol-3-phosphate acyltransferase